MPGKFFKLLIIALFLFSTAAAQNRFEGHNIILDAPETQTSMACAIRYAPPTTNITVTDLDTKTAMNVQSCSDRSVSVSKLNATTTSLRANGNNYKWCFVGEDKKYRITFNGDNFTPKVTYDWVSITDHTGFVNVRDFGAKGDGTTDDTIAIQSALAYIATRNGGTLNFPEGEYIVGGTPGFKGITLPSGVIIRGTSSINTGLATNNINQKANSSIRVRGTNRAVFRIGECSERITIQDIELVADSNENTYGIEGVGAYGTAQDLVFDRVSFNNFYRGIYAHAMQITDFNWQFDYVKVRNCRFIYNRDAGIWIKSRNSDWKIDGCLFVTPAKSPGTEADGIFIHFAMNVLIEDTFGGGFAQARGGDFIEVIENGSLTIINSQCESIGRSLVFGEVPGAGNYSFPITLINNIFTDPIEIKARRNFVSVGNFYQGETVKLSSDVRVYSTGDRFCYDGYILACRGFFNAPTPAEPGFIGGKIMFSTGQPAEGQTPGRPTVFGDSVRFDGPVQLPNLPYNNLPRSNVGNGSMVFCSTCRRNTSPCQAGGNGAPAMWINGNWNCL
jgi:hypothetical protein